MDVEDKLESRRSSLVAMGKSDGVPLRASGMPGGMARGDLPVAGAVALKSSKSPCGSMPLAMDCGDKPLRIPAGDACGSPLPSSTGILREPRIVVASNRELTKKQFCPLP